MTTSAKKILIIGGVVAFGAAVVYYLKNKSKNKAVASSGAVNTASLEYQTAVAKQKVEIAKNGSSSIDLNNPATWPSLTA